MDLGGMAIHTLSTTSNIFTTYAFLTGLYLNHNNLQVLPASIKHLQCLVLLDVSANKLHWLPPEIGDLRRLRELWSFDNYIESLPWEMAWLRSLEFLGLEGNPLMKLNPAGGGPTSMETIFDIRKSMRYEHPIAEILVRDGVQALISWFRDNMPVDVMMPATLCNRRWIRRNNGADENVEKNKGILNLIFYGTFRC
jgi:CCR4-NOT transcription complex subunit 6